MNLFAQRPTEWNAVVGQPRAITVLQAILNNKHLMLRGFLFHGVLGVGKTVTAYLLARALMCSGDEPLGCGKCDSCLSIAEHGIDAHPDFKEVDSAMCSGVDKARELIEQWGTQRPIMGKRRVTVIDEAHRLSPEAWDVFLKPLDQGDTTTIIIFVSNQVDRIQGTIRSRCTQIPFELVHPDTVVGLLANLASRNDITYELDALRLISRYTKGIVRDALNILSSAAALGTVTVEHVKLVLDTSLEDACLKLMQAIAANDSKTAIELADAAVRKARPAKVIEAMFGIYGRAVFAKENPELTKIFIGLPGVSDVTALFIKWATTSHLPVDILPVVAYELLRLHGSPEDRKARQRAAKGTGGGFSGVSASLSDMVRMAPPEGVRAEDIPPAPTPELKTLMAAPEAVAEFLSDEPEPEGAYSSTPEPAPVVAVAPPAVEEVGDEVEVPAERHVFVPTGDDGYEDDPM